MTHTIWRRILPVLLLFVAVGASHAQESGVLLGLQYPEPIPRTLPYYAGGVDSLSRSAYQTLLITEAQGAFSVMPEARELLIPRDNRFWRVGTKRSVYNNWVEDFVWAAPEGTVPVYTGIQPFNGEYCDGHRTQTILYAGPGYLSLDQRSAGYCEGGTHPWFFNTLAVVPIDSTTHPGVSIDEVFGVPASRALEKAVEDFMKTITDDERRALYLEEADPANWGLVRRDGRWIAIGRIENAEEVGPSLFIDLPLAFEVPATFAGRRQQSLDWRQVKAFAPDALDIFVAPAQTWLVILRPARLTIHTIQGGRIGPALLTKPLVPGARAVMSRWATGTQLRGWMQRFERLAQSQDSGS